MKLIKTMMKSLFLIIALCSSVAFADPLIGTTGSAAGDRWQSSWIDLSPNKSFNKSVVLYITVQGNAENVLVRLLPASAAPGSSAGIEGAVRKVPKSGIIKVVLSRNHPNIKQISVHAGREAWGTPLGGNNGAITLISVEHQGQ